MINNISQKPRILMFAPIFAPFANPEAIVNNKLALTFISKGWHIDIVTRKVPIMYGYNYGSDWVDPWLPLHKYTHEVDYAVGGLIRMRYEALRDGLNMGYILEGCRWAYHAYKLALELHKKNKYDVVLSRSLPDAGHMPALKFSRIAQIPWIANWNDPTGDKNPKPTGKGIDAKLGINLNKLLNDIKKNADWLTFPSERMRQYVCTYLGDGACQKSSVIPHAAMQYNGDKPLDDKTFKLCHAGNLYASRKPENFLQALRDFSSRINVQQKINVTIIGIENVDLKEKAKHYNVENMIHFTGPLSYADTIEQLAKNDLLIVLEGQYEEGIYLPSKFIDYVQTGRPVLSISPKISTLNDILSQYGGGIAADCCSSDSITSALCALYEHWEKGTLNDKYGSHKLYNLFAPETIIGQYVNIFNQIGLTSHQTTKF
jgi:glycosyltransferase involved in cell wall biosynthesis